MGDPFAWMTPRGEIAQRLRAIDWSDSPLGPPSTWPQSLRTAINVVLTSKIPMYVWWGPHSINFYNDAYVPIVGKRRHPRFLARPAREMWPEIWATMQGFLDETRRTGEAVCAEDLVFKLERNGAVEEAYFTFSFNPALDENGQFAGAVAIVQETTSKLDALRAEKRAQDEAQAARQELHDFLSQAPIGIAILNGPSHVFSFVNPSYLELLFAGRTAADFLQKPIRQALPELDGQGFFEILDEVYRTGTPFVGAKLHASVRQADGGQRELYVNFTYQPKRDAQGKIDGILVVVYEVTDQVNEQKEIELLASNLRAAVVSRDTFLGVASHELLTPLTSLKLQAQVVMRQIERHGPETISPDKLRRFVDHTLAQTNRVSVLVRDMLDVSRIRAGKLTMTFADVTLSTLVSGMLDGLAPQLEAASCALSTRLERDVTVQVDASRIEQVFTNLIANAVKYAPGKPVHVAVERAGAIARVVVRDEGPGVLPENQERIFGQFERATSSTGVSGLGLGLFICRRIVEQHRGRIYVESEPGRGATFVIELPLHSAGGAS